MLGSARIAALALVFALLLAGDAGAAPSPTFGSLDTAITKAAPALGKQHARDLRNRLRKARRAKRCGSVKLLGSLVSRAGRLQPVPRRDAARPVAATARGLQERLFTASAKRGRFCGLKRPAAKVSKSVKPQQPALAPAADGHSRALARVDGPNGKGTDFVQDEVVVTAPDRASVASFLARWDGKIRARGALVIASAGNEGRDVDAEDCFVVCWEEEWVAPCENDAVLCVGGVEPDGARAANSNYGYEWCEVSECDARLFAPWTVWVGPDADAKFVHKVSGTSFSSPFVAGIAAMVFAANPSLTPAQVEQTLLATADPNNNQYVSHTVNAGKAVRSVLAGNQPPLAILKTPSAEQRFQYGAFNFVALSAEAVDYNGSEGCCTFKWSSDVDGDLGTGPSLQHAFGSTGPRTITVTATDSSGASSTDSVLIGLDNSAPFVSISRPTQSEVLLRGQTVHFTADVSDKNSFAIPCENYNWSVTPAGGKPEPLATGCQPDIKFTTDGKRTITLNVADGAGGSGSSTRSVEVVAPPAKSPPFVSILSPDDGQSLEPKQTYTLTATAEDPDGEVQVTGSWAFRNGSTLTPIGSGNTISWKPGPDAGGNCSPVFGTLVFTASDADGTSSDEVDVRVNYTPC